MFRSKTPKPFSLLIKKHSENFLTNIFLSLTLSFVLNGCVSNVKRADTKNGNTQVQLKTDQVFSNYIEQKQKNFDTINSKKVRENALQRIKQNPLYKILVDQKIVDQKYLIVLQAVGHSMISEHSDLFEIDEVYENTFKNIPGALDFTVGALQLDIYGGLPKEILEVYIRYLNQYKISGRKGSIVYNTETSQRTLLENDFTLVEALTIFQYNFPNILDNYYDAQVNKLTTWQGGKGPEYPYNYLNTKIAFNHYLKANYPNSANYIHYDFLTTAQTLYTDYDANEVSADDKYKDRIIAVQGVVNKIAKDFLDKPYITLKTADYMGEIQCYFNDSEKLKTLSKGDNLTVVGTCTGKMAVIVALKGCRIF